MEITMKKTIRYAFLALVTFGAALAQGCVAGTEEMELQDDMAEEDEQVGEAEQAISISAGGHDYLFVRSARSWGDAVTECQQAGYQLAIIDDSVENAWLRAEANRAGMGDFWIGYHDQYLEGSYRWVDASIASCTNWAVGEPNNAGNLEDCAEMGSGSTWNDMPCATLRSFVCEADSGASANTLPSYAASNTNNAVTNTVNQVFWLDAGQLLTAGTCGLPSAQSSGDTYLRLYKGDNTLVVDANDACGGQGSNFSYLAPTSGWYILRQGCNGSNACGGTTAHFVK